MNGRYHLYPQALESGPQFDEIRLDQYGPERVLPGNGS